MFQFGENRQLRLSGLGALVLATALSAQPAPTFSNVTVHDPSVVQDGNTFYVFGSHLASASTTDLQHWSQISTDPVATNPLVPNPTTEFSEAIGWVAGSYGFWAPDVIRLGDGRFYFYYCIGRLDQPRAALGLAVANLITGPYDHVAILLRSGAGGQPAPAGPTYDPTIHPNTIDPAVFFDQAGKLWMVYGSYSGGIFIVEIDPATGLLKSGQGYGKKLIGGNHARIEGAYILYSPESEYYYLFVSFGGLDANGGYNIRLGRSRAPDGPYLDAAGTDLMNVQGAQGTLFDDASIAPHGVKLMGGYHFLHATGEPGATSRGYVSPGHNSAYYDPDSGKHLLFFHTRFVGRGEAHEVRVHQMFVNADDWLVVAPHRYAGESIAAADLAEIPGSYKLINHGKAITATPSASTLITLHADGTIGGTSSGSWQITGDHDVTLDLGGTGYRGVVVRQWDDDNQRWVWTFSALSGNGVAVWGSKLAIDPPPRITVHPASLTQPSGSAASLSVMVVGTGPISYQWYKHGVAIPNATGSTLNFGTLQTADAGDYTVSVTDQVGTVTSRLSRVTVATPNPGRIINMSVRSAAGVNGQPLIVGFVVEGGGKQMLVRGIGPALAAFNVTGVMTDPALAVHARVNNADAIVATNDNWGDNGQAANLTQAFGQVSAFPLPDTSSKDAALLTLVDGIRTVHINSAAVPQRGVVLVEAYDPAPSPSPRLINVSARNYAGRDAETLIAGFVIDGNAPKRVLVRGVGPTLEEFNVPGVLADPRLELHTTIDGADFVFASNDNWFDEPVVSDASASAFAFPLRSPSTDAALVLTLPAGQYTAVVSAGDSANGEALVEVYELP